MMSGAHRVNQNDSSIVRISNLIVLHTSRLSGTGSHEGCTFVAPVAGAGVTDELLAWYLTSNSTCWMRSLARSTACGDN